LFAAKNNTCVSAKFKSKGPFIATQLNSTRRRVELHRWVAIDTSPTQLNSTRRQIELCRYKWAFSLSITEILFIKKLLMQPGRNLKSVFATRRSSLHQQ